MKNNINWTLVLLVAVLALLVGGFVGAKAFPNTITQYKNVTVDKIIEVEVPVEVEVESEDLQIVLNYIYDNDGELADLDITSLDDDEISLITERIVFVNEAKVIAISAIKTDLFDELDNEVYFDGTSDEVKFDEDDLGSLRIDDEDDEITVDVNDFDEGEAVVTITGTFKQDGVKYQFSADVELEDNEADEVLINSVTLA